MRAFTLRRWIRPLMVASVLVTVVSWSLKGRLVDPVDIEPALLADPLQRQVERAAFSFVYKNQLCRVRPVAEYELHGLVVSHNNIHSVADIYHDSSSVDTKDLCVIWGPNLESTDYQHVQFSSGPWTCRFSYPAGTRFDHSALGNNHLITDSDAIRRRLADVRVGDQIHLKGLLVDYQMDDWRDFWRTTSTRRDDAGCEVVFLEQLQILRRGTPLWYTTYRLGWIALFTLPVLYVFLMWIEAGSGDSTTLGRLR